MTTWSGRVLSVSSVEYAVPSLRFLSSCRLSPSSMFSMNLFNVQCIPYQLSLRFPFFVPALRFQLSDVFCLAHCMQFRPVSFIQASSTDRTFHCIPHHLSSPIAWSIDSTLPSLALTSFIHLFLSSVRFDVHVSRSRWVYVYSAIQLCLSSFASSLFRPL